MTKCINKGIRSEVGGWVGGVQPGNRFVSCVRARAVWLPGDIEVTNWCAVAFHFPFGPSHLPFSLGRSGVPFPLRQWDQGNPSEIKWVQVSSSEIHWVQVNPSEIKWVQVRSSESKWIQVSPSEPKWDQVNPSESKWVQVRSSESKWDQVSPNEFKWDPLLPPILLSNFSWHFRYILYT